MSEQARLLVVDDEQVVRESLYHWFTQDGYCVDTADNAKAALQKLRDVAWDVLLVDIKMPGMDGLQLHAKVKALDPDLPVIIMTAYASVDTAVRALKEGAYDYIVKPFDPEELEHVVRGAAERHKLVRENARLKQHIEAIAEEGISEIIGKSPQIQQVKELIRTVAGSDTTVLIIGESGTGKELVARAIHHAGPRRQMPLVSVNCAGLPETLVESELFGHEKGAFTGAEYKRKGKFELADGGTIFIDEIGDISAKTQIDLLRVLEEKAFTRIGGSTQVASDFRVIAATNQDLKALMEQGRFRRDLYYRINVFTIALPPLRERRGDIPLLVDHFMAVSANALKKPLCRVSQDALDVLMTYDWPGNIRELENAIERGMLVQKGDELCAADLPISNTGAKPSGNSRSLEEIESRHIQEVLDSLDGNIAQAARVLAIDRVTLYNKIRKYDLKRQ